MTLRTLPFELMETEETVFHQGISTLWAYTRSGDSLIFADHLHRNPYLVAYL